MLPDYEDESRERETPAIPHMGDRSRTQWHAGRQDDWHRGILPVLGSDVGLFYHWFCCPDRH